jgi:hypothetical protein
MQKVDLYGTTAGIVYLQFLNGKRLFITSYIKRHLNHKRCRWEEGYMYFLDGSFVNLGYRNFFDEMNGCKGIIAFGYDP